MDFYFLKFAYKILQANFDLLKNPFKLNFAITYRCNLKCKICNIWKKRPKKELTLKEIEKFVKINNFFSWVSLTGGEPFIRRDIVKIAQLFKENSKNFYLLNIPTNGTMPEIITKKVLEILELEIPEVVVTVSIDGPPNVHNSIKGFSWNSAVKTFRNLKEIANENKNFKTFVAFTLSPLNVGVFGEAYKTIKKEIPCVTPGDVHINIFHYSKHYYSNLNFKIDNYSEYNKKLEKEIRKIIKLKDENLDLIKFVRERYLRFAMKFIKTGKTPLPCKALLTSIFMDPLGNVYPCMMWNKKLGNIKNFNYDLKEILHQKNIKKIIREIKQKECPNCWSPCEANQTIISNLFNINFWSKSRLDLNK